MRSSLVRLSNSHLIAGSIACLASQNLIAADSPDSLAPPIAQVHPFIVLAPFGKREDDYYWLRDDTRKSREMLDYLAAENAYTDAKLAPTKALQDKIYDELVGRIKQDDSSVPVFDHGYWYYRRFETGGQYPIFARRRGSMDAPEEIMLDGNAMAAGKDFFMIGDTEVSPDGQLLAYAEDDVGRRQYTLRIKNLATGEMLTDQVKDIEPNLVWSGDGKTVLYVEKDPVTLLSVRVRKHVLGDHSGHDTLAYEEHDHSYYLQLGKSKSEEIIFIQLASTLQSEWHYARADDPRLAFKVALARTPKHEYQLEHIGGEFVMRTNWHAHNFQLVRAPVAKIADHRAWQSLLPPREDRFIEDFEVFKDYVAVSERTDGLMKLHVHSWDGKKDFQIAADETSYAMHLSSTPGPESNTLRYTYTSLTTPRSTFAYDLASDQKTLLKREPVLGGFDQSNYVTEYLRAPAADGTLIPVTIAYRKGVTRDGTAPLYQYGYGSYGLSSDPEFRSNWVSLMDRGFVVAIAHVRGGEELGRSWYENGKLLKKRNTFTDFIDVTHYLVREKIVASDKVFAMGGSAGGLLIGAVANLAPQSYRGIVAHVPFVDVVTTMLDESIPLTTNEFDEWGNPKKHAYYDYMLSYSPYDNVRATAYPAMLVTTGLWDSQVQYYEPAKWVAKLRALKTDKNPLLFRINMEAGHGGKSGRFEKLHETATEYQFILDQLGMKD